MTRKQRRGVLIGTCLAVLHIAVGLVLFAMRDSIVFFYSPSEVAEMKSRRAQGSGSAGSSRRGAWSGARDDDPLCRDRPRKTLAVTYRRPAGSVPRGARGRGRGGARARRRLPRRQRSCQARRDHMPPEVAKKLKSQGLWRDDAAAKPADADAKVN